MKLHPGVLVEREYRVEPGEEIVQGEWDLGHAPEFKILDLHEGIAQAIEQPHHSGNQSVVTRLVLGFSR
jgi:hypothetical protein